MGNIAEILKNYGDHKVGMVRDKVRELAAFMENYEFLRKKRK